MIELQQEAANCEEAAGQRATLASAAVEAAQQHIQELQQQVRSQLL